MIESLEDREVLAKKVGAHNVVIDVYVVQRDRLALQSYRSKLVNHLTGRSDLGIGSGVLVISWGGDD
jgi:hypothetical protein